MFRFRVRKIPGPLLKFTQKTVLFQDISIFFVLKTELYLSSGTYFFFWKLVFHFTLFPGLFKEKSIFYSISSISLPVSLNPWRR